ncbi:MAG: hypothetical protein ABSF15_20360 [Candidatus Sulfotelmatobacter sp.]|jgi:hypothetical protein
MVALAPPYAALCPRSDIFAAAPSALSAGFGALLHLHVLTPAELLATAGTQIADLSANATRVGAQVGSSKHEIGGSEADLGTILQQPDMIRFGVFAGLFQAILNGFRAQGVTMGAIVNTGLKVRVSRHVFYSSLS